MEKCSLIIVFVISILSSYGGVSVADEHSKIVCGEEIADQGEFGWSKFSEGRGEPYLELGDKTGLYEELRELLIEQSDDWQSDVRVLVVKAATGLIEGDRVLSEFTISKDLTVLPAQQFVFLRTPQVLELPPNEASADCKPESRKQALIETAQFSMLVQRSGVEINSEKFKQIAEVTQALEGVYDKYLFEGFPMYPWETFANSWLLTDKSIANGPPRNQLVLMHPAAGVVGAIGSGSDTDIGAVLSVEPIGWIHYSKDYESWYGVSLLTVFPSDRDAGIGVGLNYNFFKLGVTWHDYDDDYDNPTLFLGLDLYGFVDKKYRKYSTYKEKVEGLLLKE